MQTKFPFRLLAYITFHFFFLLSHNIYIYLFFWLLLLLFLLFLLLLLLPLYTQKRILEITHPVAKSISCLFSLLNWGFDYNSSSLLLSSYLSIYIFMFMWDEISVHARFSLQFMLCVFLFRFLSHSFTTIYEIHLGILWIFDLNLIWMWFFLFVDFICSPHFLSLSFFINISWDFSSFYRMKWIYTRFFYIYS